jgi:putative flippase GtrA
LSAAAGFSTAGPVTPEVIQQLASHAIVRQVVRFAAVGVLATGSHYVVLIALVELAHMRPVIATTIGYCVGIVVSYSLNRRFTFVTDAPVVSSFVKFAVLYGIGMALNAVIMGGLIAWGAPYLLAQVAATAIVLFWNFLGARYIVFR